MNEMTNNITVNNKNFFIGENVNNNDDKFYYLNFEFL